MLKLKIKKLKKLNQVKEAFSFISASQKIDAMFYDNCFLPLHDLYDTMIDNMASKAPLQFYAKLEKFIIGAMVSSPLPYDNTSLYLHVFSIQKQFREKGFAKTMLFETLNLATKNNYRNIRVDYNMQSASFFEKRSFKLFLEILIPNNSNSFVEKQIWDMNLNLVNIKSYKSLHIAKFEVEKYTRKILNMIKNISPDLKAKFVFERNIEPNAKHFESYKVVNDTKI